MRLPLRIAQWKAARRQAEVNSDPEASPVAPQTVVVGSTTEVSLAGVVTDPDGGTVTLGAPTTSNASVVTASIDGTTLTLTGVGAGTATVSVTGSDGKGGSVVVEIAVTVELWTTSTDYTTSALLTSYDEVVCVRAPNATATETSQYFGRMSGGAWKRLWVDIGAPTLLGAASNQKAVAVATLGPDPFDAGYDAATSRLPDTVANGATYTHEADCLVGWTMTTLGVSGGARMRLRAQDATNYWYVRVQTNGTVELQEVVAGSATARGSAAAVVAAGSRVAVVAVGATISVYVDGVLRIQYASAASFQAATSGGRGLTHTSPVEDAVVSNLVAWPRTPSGSALAALNAI